MSRAIAIAGSVSSQTKDVLVMTSAVTSARHVVTHGGGLTARRLPSPDFCQMSQIQGVRIQDVLLSRTFTAAGLLMNVNTDSADSSQSAKKVMNSI